MKPAALRAGAGGRRALQRNIGPGPESGGLQCRRCLCRQPRRRPRSARQTPRLVSTGRRAYLVTTFNNAVNNHQNNLRLSAGVVLRF
jgi:hypothetical protein